MPECECGRDLDEAGRSTDDAETCTFCAVIEALRDSGSVAE